MASPAGISTGVPLKVKRVSYKQRRMGPAPFASFEDLSDDLDSPEDKPPLNRMPGIREDVRVGPDGCLMSPESGAGSSLAGGGLQTPSTPRIDISRASSSSHHDSNNSSPERELYAEGAVGGAKLGLGFKEEGTADLRSSTEELDFHTETGTVQEREYQRRKQKQINKLSASSTVSKYELEAQSEKERKDSTCSDLGLLSISGRTSRLSSVGSAASGGSGISHLSNTSRLSVTGSHMSGASGRSTSPHKMLLETSFCGSKPIVSQSVDIDSPPSSNKHETESLEKVLLAKNVDPRMAIVGDVTTKVGDDDEHEESSGGGGTDDASVRVVDRPRREEVGAVNGAEARGRGTGEDREPQKPITLNLSDTGKSYRPVQSFSQLVQRPPAAANATPSVSPRPSRHRPAPVPAGIRREEGSRTPSPPGSGSRKSSFTSLFRRNESGGILSPESPTVSAAAAAARKVKQQGLKEPGGVGHGERSPRSRSKSGERTTEKPPPPPVEPRESKTKKDAKNKSVFSSFFKKKDRKKGGAKEGDILSPIDISSPEPPKLPVLDAISNVEFTFNTEGSCQPSEFGIIRNERPQPVLPEDSLLPSESVMLPTLSNLYQDHKELEPDVEKQEATPDLRVQKRKRSVPEVPTPIPEARTPPELIRLEDEAEHHSSESERDSEMEYIGNRAEERKREEGEGEEEEDHERKGLFVQQDSVDEELPYIPTTLPQERTVGVPLVPAKQRATAEVRTFPIERPRSVTPINPSLLDEYVGANPQPSRELRMKISLPREDSITSKKSPRRTQPRSWFEFAEQGLQSPKDYRKTSLTSATSPSPPPLPPRAQTTSPPRPQNWINFEEIPEKRKPPKRIQTIPSRSNIDIPEPPRDGKTYNYVNPEDCKCECHESSHRHQSSSHHHHRTTAAENGGGRCSHSTNEAPPPPPRLEVEDRHSYMSDSSYEYVSRYGGEGGEDFNADGLKVMKPFGMDLDVSSNRSSVISQDDQPSPDGDPPPPPHHHHHHH